MGNQDPDYCILRAGKSHSIVFKVFTTAAGISKPSCSFLSDIIISKRLSASFGFKSAGCKLWRMRAATASWSLWKPQHWQQQRDSGSLPQSTAGRVSRLSGCGCSPTHWREFLAPTRRSSPAPNNSETPSPPTPSVRGNTSDKPRAKKKKLGRRR